MLPARFCLLMQSELASINVATCEKAMSPILDCFDEVAALVFCKHMEICNLRRILLSSLNWTSGEG